MDECEQHYSRVDRESERRGEFRVSLATGQSNFKLTRIYTSVSICGKRSTSVEKSGIVVRAEDLRRRNKNAPPKNLVHLSGVECSQPECRAARYFSG